MRRLGLVAVLVGHAGLAHAQSWEASMLAGYTPSAGLERRARELDQLDVGGGFTLGAQVARVLSPRWSAELLWTQQHTALDTETSGGRNHFFTFTVDNFHANAIRHLNGPDAKLRPFVFAGLGASLLSGAGLPSEAKFSWGIGGGAKYFPRQSIGVRGHVRYKPVILNDAGSGDFCDPFGFCQGWLNQVELAAGVTVRF